MRKSAPGLILCTCLLLWLPVLHAQPVRWPVRYFNADNGLPQNTVRDVVQDDDGWLWVGTDNGICLFDGYSFHYLDERKGGDQLQRGATRFYKEKSNIWIFQQGTIGKYDAKTRSITAYKINPANSAGIYPIYIDSIQIIYYSDRKKYSFNRATGKDRLLPSSRDVNKIASQDLDMALLAPNNGYLVYTEKQERSFLAQLNTTSFSMGESRALPSRMRSVCHLENSWLYLGYDNNIYYAANINDKPVIVAGTHILPDKYEQLVQLKITDHEYLVAAAGDLFYIKSYPLFSIHPVTQTDGSAIVQKGKVMRIFKDIAGNIWLATNANGLIQVPASGNTFNLYRSDKPEENFIRTIQIDTFTHNIWAGLFFSNLVVFNKDGVVERELTNRVQRLIGKRSVVNYIHFLNRNELLVFAEFEKTFHINLEKNTVTACIINARYPAQHFSQQHLINSVSHVMPLGNARFLKLFQRQVFNIAYRNDTVFVNRIKPLPDGCENIYKLNANSFWIPTKRKALNIDSTGSILDSIVLSTDVKTKTIVIDRNGHYWIGTEKGLYVFNEKKLIHTLSTKNGLPNDFFYTLATDNAGYIWCSTNKGLLQVDINTFRFRSFTVDDGLQANEFNSGAVYTAKDGTIFFGGISGMNSFHPPMVSRITQKIPVKIIAIRSGDSLLSAPLDNIPKQLDLSSSAGNLSIFFSAFNFATPGSNEYEYRLNNSKEWLSTAGRNVLQLFLTPGQYSLQLRLKNQPLSATELNIRIAPPFYQSWWFIIACLATVGIIIGLVAYAYARSKYQKEIAILAMNQQLQLEKDRISRELHDDLGAKANLLSYNASLLSEEKEGTHSTAISNRIKDAADDMLLSLRETMWTLKQETITTTEVWIRFKNFISKMQRTYQQIDFSIEENIDAEKTLAYNDALNLVRILQEALNNAIRHSQSNIIYCSANAVKDQVVFSVKDKGTGFEKATTDNDSGNGMSNMRFRAGQSGFMLKIDSGNGTTITVTV